MIHFALVGCGHMAAWHAEQLRLLPEARIVAMVASVPERATDLQEKLALDGVDDYTSYDELLERPPSDLNAVVLVTPHALHHAQAREALLRGWHVLTEKPMVTRTADAYDLWRLARRAGRQLGITYQAPYSAEFQCLRSLRESGRLGAVQIIQGWVAQGWLKETAGTWRQDPALSGGGQLYDSGSHVLNAMLWLMDEPVVEASCMIDRCGSPVDINGVATLRFASGALGSVAIGGNSVGWHNRIAMQTDRLQAVTGAHGEWLEITGDETLRYPPVPSSDAPGAFTPHRNFVQSVLGHESPQVTARHGAALSVVMDALYASAESGRSVRVEPVPREVS